MCLAVPLKIVEINGLDAVGEVEGLRRRMRLDFIKEPKLGEYVIVHAGFAIERLPEKQALSIATRLELPIRKPNCPAAGHTKREEMKQVMRFFTGLIPDAEERIMNAIADTEKYGMWDNLRLPPRDVLDIVSSPKAPRFCRECPNSANKSDDNGEDE